VVIRFDPAKSRRNIETRGLSFELVEEMDWSTALITVDDRKLYPEPRYIARGMINGKVHTVVFSFESGAIRVISLRLANRKERHSWHESQTLT
jgi:uncharacterized DUF497 family protein